MRVYLFKEWTQTEGVETVGVRGQGGFVICLF